MAISKQHNTFGQARSLACHQARKGCTLNRRKQKRAGLFVAQNELHGPVTKITNPIEEYDGAVAAVYFVCLLIHAMISAKTCLRSAYGSFMVSW